MKKYSILRSFHKKTEGSNSKNLWCLSQPEFIQDKHRLPTPWKVP